MRQLEKFSIDTKFRDLIVHGSITVLKKFKKNLLTNFVLIAVFMKVVLELQKELSIAFYPNLDIFMCFLITQVYLRSAASRVYKGHLQTNE